MKKTRRRGKETEELKKTKGGGKRIRDKEGRKRNRGIEKRRRE